MYDPAHPAHRSVKKTKEQDKSRTVTNVLVPPRTTAFQLVGMTSLTGIVRESQEEDWQKADLEIIIHNRLTFDIDRQQDSAHLMSALPIPLR